MACATLKRSLDWEPVLGGRPAKRRRCLPFCESPRERASPPLCLNSPTTTSTSKTTLAALLSTPTTLSSLSSSLTSLSSSSSSLSSSSSTTTTTTCSSSSSSSPPSKSTAPIKPISVFPDVVSKKLTPEYMAENIKAELRRLHRRKQLQYNTENNTENGGNATNVEPPSRLERPLFTFKQVGLICERMVRELESEIREEYDNVLAGKLAEQYDAFVKFTYDQIHKNYNEATPSYLS